MINFAKFEFIGRIGEIDAKAKVTNISVCANYRPRGEGDQWIEDSYWNRVVLFSDGQRKYVEEKPHVGDLVRIAGRLRDSSYEREGITHYTTDRIVEEFGVLAPKASWAFGARSMAQRRGYVGAASLFTERTARPWP